jgi:hypothetical protein
MSVNGVEIRVGQIWKTRGGAEAVVTSRVPAMRRAIQVQFKDGTTSSLYLNGRQFGEGDGTDDLLFLVECPEARPERRLRGEPSSNQMRRKTDWPNVKPTVEPVVPDLKASPEEFAASIPGALGEPEVPANSPRRGMSEAIPPFAKMLIDEFEREQAERLEEMLAEVDKHSALSVQVGGGHYKSFAIQPVEFIHRNGIPFIEGNAIKYLCRWRDKGGIQDLEKVKHYIDLLIEMEREKAK